AFGLPAERHAVRTGEHPAIVTKRNCDTFRRQIQALGLSYDWDREINTTDPSYYKWTQWIFIVLFERGLAYETEAPVNWCPALGTVLANEEVKDGKYVETGDPVEKRMMRQWMLKITAYAEKLLEDLNELDWPPGIIAMQREWIGRSEGADVYFRIEDTNNILTVFTTRPDTLFGATYCVIAPEHPFVLQITKPEYMDKVIQYIEQAARKSAQERMKEEKEKTGVFTGAYAINPVNNEKVPIWVADYVLAEYGYGAIMAVPAHDTRDYQFAKEYNLHIVEVVSGGDITTEAYTGDGILVNSPLINGLTVPEAKKKITKWLEEHNLGKATVNYKLRDWLFSRQRYWGEPFPIIRLQDGTVKTVPLKDLPVLLPDLDDYRPTETGEPPLARAKDWVNTVDPETGQPATRETNTMPQWAGSCWYFLRFVDAQNNKEAWSKEAEKYWMPVDLYIGGAEHAVLHLLYSRFWHKVLYDAGYVSTSEPFKKLFNQGMILAYSYQDSNGKYYYPHQVEQRDGQWFVKGTNIPVETKIEKMSKSRYNVVNPDEVIKKYGADAMRMYEMFMGPLERDKPWTDEGIQGVYRFLRRIWSLFIDDNGKITSKFVETGGDSTIVRELHKTIKSVADDIEKLQFNTAIAKMMEFVNLANKTEKMDKEVGEKFILILSPFAPHIAEEIWQRLGHQKTLAYEPWPQYDINLIKEDTIEIPIQVNGKLRGKITISITLSDKEILEQARCEEKILPYLQGKQIIKEIYVPGKLVNFVVKG
ncbi:MAG TPA: leucine--tRNA ligase, partial [Candidatus Hydrogenedens sp.]|nr:leucine--tRNA ligase [Candidatus Hydrogenedens sp.]